MFIWWDFSPLWMAGTQMIPDLIWALGNVWPKFTIKISSPSSCPCLATAVLKLVLRQNLKHIQIPNLNLSLYSLFFVLPALWLSVLQILIASALCNHDLCLLNLEKTNKLFSFLFSALLSGNAVQKKSWGGYRAHLTYFPFFRGHSPALLLSNILKYIFNVFPQI